MVVIEELSTQLSSQFLSASSPQSLSKKPRAKLGHESHSASSKSGGTVQATIGTSLPIQEQDTPVTISALLSVREADELVSNLRVFTLQEVGSSTWLRQHQALERLNAQAHQSARCPDSHDGEFIVEAFTAHDKITCLLHELILLDVWKDKVWPRLISQVVARGASTRAYFVLFHEATLVNLLQVLLYHLKACEAAGDALVDLVDYCAGKLTLLNGGAFAIGSTPGTIQGPAEKDNADDNAISRAAALAKRDPQESLEEQARTVDFQVAVTAVGILRLVCGHLDDLPLSVSTRLVHTHDVPLALVPLLENPPWVRKRPWSSRETETREGRQYGGASPQHTWEKLGPDLLWHAVAPADLLLLSKHEAQAWLMLFHLLTSPQVRQRYPLNRFRKHQLLRVRKYLSDVLLDQLPVLIDVRRYLDELALMEVPENTAAAGKGRVPSFLLVEQVAPLRSAVLARLEPRQVGNSGKTGVRRGAGKEEAWEEVVRATLTANFSREKGDAQDPDLALLASLYSSEWVDEAIASTKTPDASRSETSGKDMAEQTAGEGGRAGAAGGAEGPCSHCGKRATKRCGRCKRSEWYCSRDCQVTMWKSHKPVCDAAVKTVGSPLSE